MIAGHEGIHAWTPPGAGTAAIEMGRVKEDDGDALWPRFTLKRVSGLGSLGEPEANYDRPPGAPREIPRRSLRRGKTVTYEGILKARNLFELREAEEVFRAAFDDLSAEGRMDVFWHPLLLAARPEFAAVPAKFYEARVLTADIIDAQDSKQFWRPYVVGLRMSDRRYFDEASEVHTVEIKQSMTKVAF